MPTVNPAHIFRTFSVCSPHILCLSFLRVSENSVSVKGKNYRLKFLSREFPLGFLSALNAIFFSAAAYFQYPLFPPVLDCSLLFRWSPWRRKTKFYQKRKTVEVSNLIYPFFSNLKESCRFGFYNHSKTLRRQIYEDCCDLCEV